MLRKSLLKPMEVAMRRRHTLICAAVGLVCLFGLAANVVSQNQPPPANQQKQPQWAMNATIIEACSCPMFCQCYFDTKPAAHGAGGAHAGHGDAHAGHG